MAVGLWYPVGSRACRGLGAVVCLDSVRQSVSARASGTASTAG
jgi:hypothetical protein